MASRCSTTSRDEVWKDDIDGALNYAELLPEDDLLVDDTNYPTDFTRR